MLSIEDRAIGGTCLCCNTDFGTRPELLTHLKYRVAKCYNHYLSQVPLLDPDVFTAAQQQDHTNMQARKLKGLRPTTAVTPAIRPPGFRRRKKRS